MSDKTQSFLDKCIKDKKGNIVIGERPNWSIIGRFICKALSYLVTSPSYANGFKFLEIAFLFTWASLEFFKGTNYLRRFFGFIVLVIIVLPKFTA